MQLENVFPHKRNTNVTVNGNIYRIGAGGFIADGEGEPFEVPEEDAAKLLQGRAWRALSWDPADPANSSRFASASAVTPSGRKGRPPRDMQQLEADYGQKFKNTKGEVVKGPVTPAASLENDPEAAKALGIKADQGVSDRDVERLQKADAAQARESAKLALKSASTPAGKAEAETMAASAGLATGEAAVGDGRPAASAPKWTVPADGNWPDPKEAMPIEYLHEMADAYEVKYGKKLGKKKLVKKIHDEMYPEILE